MSLEDSLATGNAYSDGAPRNGWFVGTFIHKRFGPRCRLNKHDTFTTDERITGDFELKMYRHPAGHCNSGCFPYNKTATTMTMLIGEGRFELYFCYANEHKQVTLKDDGDYAIWGPNVGHFWIASKESSIFTIRCPAVERDQVQTLLAQVPEALKQKIHESFLQPEECGSKEGMP